MSKQTRYAEEEKERLKDEKMARERVLELIEVDKVQRREKEERRKEAARVEADETSRGSGFDCSHTAYAVGAIPPRSGSSRPNSSRSGQSHQSDVRLPRSESRPSPSSLSRS